MRTVAVIQARLGSTRLPEKVLETFGGFSAIEHVYLRTRCACFHTVVAVPASDLKLIRALKGIGIPHFAWDGDPEDVLGRFRACAEHHHADLVVRITADCPFVQPAHIQAIATLARLHGNAYLGPLSGWPNGLDVHAFNSDVLHALEATDREHVVKHIFVAQVTNVPDRSAHHWTLDTHADLAWFRKISERVNVKPPFHPTVDELLNAIEQEPDLGHYA